MRITRLQTRGFKRDDIDEALGLLTLVIGENETGKSHILDAIHIHHLGAPAGGGLFEVTKNLGGVLRYARDPREGLSITAHYAQPQATAVRRLAVNRRGEAKWEVDQDLDPSVTGEKQKAALLAGLLPTADLWDVRELVNQSAPKLRAQLLGLFGDRLALKVVDLCPPTAADWSLPQPREPAHLWVMRIAAEAKRLRTSVNEELAEAQATFREHEDAWAKVEGANHKERLAEIERLLGEAQARGEKEARVQGLATSLATLRERAGLPLVDLAPLVERRDAAVKEADAAASDATDLCAAANIADKLADSAADALKATAGHIERTEAGLKKKPTPCTACGHIEGWDEQVEAATRDALAVARARMKEETATFTRLTEAAHGARQVADEAAKVSTTARKAAESADRALRDATRDRQAEEKAREGIDELETTHMREEAELDEMPVHDVPALLSERARLQADEKTKAESVRRHRAFTESKAAVKRLEDALTKLEDEASWIPGVATRVMEALEARICDPISQVVGERVSLSLTTRMGDPDCRFAVGGVDVAGMNEARVLGFISGMKLALAPMSPAPLKLLTLDRFESISKLKREPFLRRLLEAARAGTVHQVIVAGCPDTIPAGILGEPDVVVIQRGGAE
jgi:hypothetical protein